MVRWGHNFFCADMILKRGLLFVGIVGLVVGSYFAGNYFASPGAKAEKSTSGPEVVFIEEGDEDGEEIVVFTDGLGSISWTLHAGAPDGLQVVWSRDEGPEYPEREGDHSLYVTEDKTSASIEAFDGDGTYFVRVCILDGEDCGIYSKEIQATFGAGTEPREGLPVNPLNQPKISLFSTGGLSVKWTINGIAEHGVELVWSKTSGPTFPARAGDRTQLYNKQTSSTGGITAFDGDGIYYVRVCEYVGNGCRAYSNQIEIRVGDVPEDADEELEEVDAAEEEVVDDADTEPVDEASDAPSEGTGDGESAETNTEPEEEPVQ